MIWAFWLLAMHTGGRKTDTLMVVGCSYKGTQIQTDSWDCKLAGIVSLEVGTELIKGRASLQVFHSRMEGVRVCKFVCVSVLSWVF